MGAKVLLALTVVVYLTTGSAPRMREVRNPDAEVSGGRVAASLKRNPLLSRRCRAREAPSAPRPERRPVRAVPT